jgi:CelD/BcsL family acetyltransferase involved in cellulose biosynthesis
LFIKPTLGFIGYRGWSISSDGLFWRECVRVDVLDLTALPEALADRWRALQGLTPSFASPLVGPDFARFVARYRPDSKVAIGFQDEVAVAFFAFHPAKNGYVRAIGAPFCDYQAIVSDPKVPLNGEAYLSAAGISSIALSSLMDPHNLFDKTALEVVEAHRIDCNGDGPAFFESLRVANLKWSKNLRRLTNKMDRELGPVRLVAHDTSAESYDIMMAIKVGQFYQTGVTNVLRPIWVQNFMRDLFNLRDPNFGGCMVSLYAGDKFVAGHFGVRQGDWFHPWIASTCPLSHPYSPGIIFLGEMVRQSDQVGLRVIDLSAGHGHYKNQFCRSPILVHAGVVGAKPQTAPNQGAGPLALIDRRLDLISAVEPDFLGQMTAIGTAIATIPRRIAARRARSEHAQST